MPDKEVQHDKSTIRLEHSLSQRLFDLGQAHQLEVPHLAVVRRRNDIRRHLQIKDILELGLEEPSLASGLLPTAMVVGNSATRFGILADIFQGQKSLLVRLPGHTSDRCLPSTHASGCRVIQHAGVGLLIAGAGRYPDLDTIGTGDVSRHVHAVGQHAEKRRRTPFHAHEQFSTLGVDWIDLVTPPIKDTEDMLRADIAEELVEILRALFVATSHELHMPSFSVDRPYIHVPRDGIKDGRDDVAENGSLVGEEP